MDNNPISSTPQSHKTAIRMEIGPKNYLDAIHPDSNTVITLTIDSVAVATLRVREGGLTNSEADSHHYLIRPLGCTRNQIIFGRDIFHRNGTCSLFPDNDHRIGGYFNSGTTVIINDRLLSLPSTLVEESRLDFVEMPPIHSPTLGPKILSESQIHPGIVEPMEFYYTHHLGTVLGVSHIGKRQKNQDVLAVLCSQEQVNPSRLELLVLDGNYQDGDLAALAVAERRKVDFTKGISPRKSFVNVSNEMQNRSSSQTTPRGTTVCSAIVTAATDSESVVELSNLGDSRFLILQANQHGEFEITARTRPHNFYHELIERGFTKTQLIQLARTIFESKPTDKIARAQSYLKNQEKESLLDIQRMADDTENFRSRYSFLTDPLEISQFYVESLKSRLTRGIYNLSSTSTESTPDTYQALPLFSGDIILGFTDGLESIESQMIALINQHRSLARSAEALTELMDKTALSDNASFILFQKS